MKLFSMRADPFGEEYLFGNGFVQFFTLSFCLKYGLQPLSKNGLAV
jgi:hypothetical protein